MESRLRIIIFEDDPAITDLLKTALTKIGHHVFIYSEATGCPLSREDSCCCQQDFPCADVLISDIVMPHMTGIDFYKRLRSKGCKVIEANKALMSATTREEYLDEVEELGYKIFTKPFRLKQIAQWLNECSDRIPEGRTLAAIA